jgi:cyclase
MLTRRLIACLDVRDGQVVKGVRFGGLRAAGDPAALARRYNAEGVDELVVLDVTATLEGRGALADTVRAVARELFIPLTVGGGIRSFDDARAVVEAGADKVAINSAALADPSLITRLAERYGSQAVVVAIDARRIVDVQPAGAVAGPAVAPARYEVRSRAATAGTELDAVTWAVEAESRGAGEILLTSIDRDGTRAGFECELTSAVSGAVRIPVIASGGAGEPAHFAEVFTHGRADAALAASVFHYSEHAVADLKAYLAARGVPVRPVSPSSGAPVYER